MTDPQVLKQIKIKTGSMRRILRDYEMYKEEAAKQQEKIQKMIEDCEEEYNVAKQKEVLQETLSMLPGTKQRIDSSYEDLDMIITGYAEDHTMQETEEYKNAFEVLQKVSEFLESYEP